MAASRVSWSKRLNSTNQKLNETVHFRPYKDQQSDIKNELYGTSYTTKD